MTSHDATVNAADGAEGDDGGSFLAEETMAPDAMGDEEPTTEEEERPPPRLMITKMVRGQAGPFFRRFRLEVLL